MLKELMSNGKQYIDHFFEHLDLTMTEEIVQALAECKGTLFFSGVGKSEITAKKIAVTMASTGTRALFMTPINALHGDIGLLTANDYFIMLSKGGESEELLNLIPYIQNKGAKTLAIVSDGGSRLARFSDKHIILPLARELCPFNLAPTTSTQIQMIFGDLLTVALMRRKNFTLEEYAVNHPSGKIGRRINTKVENLMLKGELIPRCTASTQIKDAILELSKKRCGCVFIVDENHALLGIFTDGDLGRVLNKFGTDSLNKEIQDVMTFNPKCIEKQALAWEALQRMEADKNHPITVLAVTNEHNILEGLIKMHDILQAGI